MARIMVVDDSPTDVQSIKSILSKAGHAVMESSSAQDAISRIKQEKPDCILMDIVMPGISGFHATRTISSDPATSHIPILVISSKDQPTDRVWALRQGARDYIVKPVKETDLLAKIKTVLGS
jgi:twitching motility two-component system response regulator PilH